MTLVEFLHPVRKGKRQQQVLGVLYYFKHYKNQPNVTVGEIRQALASARVPQARTINIPDVLGSAAPYTDRVGPRGVWTLTGQGDDWVRLELGLDHEKTEAVHDVRALEALVAKIKDDKIRDYVEEAVNCLEIDARRAAVVFLWAGVVATIRAKLWAKAKKPEDIDAVLKNHNPKARTFKKEEDFDYVNDAALIEISGDLSVFDRSERKQLGQALDLRNDCGHPGNYKPGEKKVSSFIEDVLAIAFA